MYKFLSGAVGFWMKDLKIDEARGVSGSLEKANTNTDRVNAPEGLVILQSATLYVFIGVL
jgi:hypothetical protein